MIKIGIDARSLEGSKTGVGRYLENLLKFWRAASDYEFFLFFKQEIPKDEFLESKNFKLILKQSRSNFIFTHFTLPSLIKKYQCDIFFAPGYIAPLFIKTPYALTLHDIIFEARPDLYNWPSKADIFNLKLVAKISAKNAKIIFTPSQFTKNEVIKYYKIEPSKIIVTPLAPDPRFQQTKFKNELKKDNFFIFVGACFDRRHVIELISAIAKLKKNNYNVSLIIAGPDLTNKKNIAKIAQNINKSFNDEVIIYKPYIETKDLVLLYSKTTSAVYLSEYEGFGLPIIEAMACGAPVITGPAQALKETAGSSAIILESLKVDEIYNNLKLILDNDNLKKELSLKSLKRAKEFSWQQTANNTLLALEKLNNV